MKMNAMIENNPDDVYHFVRFRFVESRNSTMNGLRRKNKRHSFEIKAIIEDETFLVQIDYIFGEFLVNGLPMGRLPEKIIALPAYRRIFGNTTFEV